MSKFYQGSLFSEKEFQTHQFSISENIIVVKKRDRNWIEAHVPPKQVDWIRVIKRIEGRHWDAAEKCWVLPYVRTTFYDLRDYIKLSNIDFEFKIEVSIPKEYISNKNAEISTEVHLVEKFDQLTESQKGAILKLEEYLILRRYSRRTISSYRCCLINVFRFHKNIAPENYFPDHIQIYLLELMKTKKVSTSTQNQIISAYKIFAEKILKRPKEYIECTRPKKSKKLPGVLSVGEVIRLFKSTQNLKHKLILLIIYSSGLRISEAVNVLISNLQIERRRIHIQGAKGKKDRYVVLAESVVPYLKRYLKTYRPKRWLFEGLYGGAYSQRSVQNVFNKALEKSNINAYATVHTLRHSYATHCLENGHNLKTVQAALGHKSLKTTEIYLHLTSDALKNLKSPLDEIKR